MRRVEVRRQVVEEDAGSSNPSPKMGSRLASWGPYNWVVPQLWVILALSVFLLSNVFDLTRQDAMVILNGDAYSAAVLPSIYNEEWTGDSLCRVNDATTCTPVSTENGTASRHDTTIFFQTAAPHTSASFTVRIENTAKPLFGIRASGSPFSLYGQKADGSQLVLLGRVNASESAVSTFFPPHPVKYLRVEVDGPQVTVHKVILNCPGCDWHDAPVITPNLPPLIDGNPATASMVTSGEPVVFRLPKPSVLSGVSVIFPQADSDSYDPASLRIQAKDAAGQMIEIEHVNVTRRDLLPPPARQIFYFKEVLVKEAILTFYSTQLSIELAEVALGRTCTKGLPPGVDATQVVHYVKNTNRKVLMDALSRRVGLQVEIRGDWTRERVLRERGTVARAWPPAKNLAVGEKILEWEGARHSESWRDIQNNASRTRYTKVTSRFLGRAANLQQHMSIFQTMWERGTRVGLVLEDDVIFVKHFNSLLSKVLAEAPDPDQWDIIFIAGCLNKRAWSSAGTQYRPNSLLWRVRQHRCASGYLVTRRFLEKIVMTDYPRYDMFMNIDPLLEALMLNTITDAFWTEPPILYEGSKALIGSSVYGSYRV